MCARLASDHVDAGGDIPPLVRSADLKFAAVALVERHEVVGLQQHVGELGVGDPLLAIEAALDRLFRQHRVHGDELADVTKKLECGDVLDPRTVIDELCLAADVEQ